MDVRHVGTYILVFEVPLDAAQKVMKVDSGPQEAQLRLGLLSVKQGKGGGGHGHEYGAAAIKGVQHGYVAVFSTGVWREAEIVLTDCPQHIAR